MSQDILTDGQFAALEAEFEAAEEAERGARKAVTAAWEALAAAQCGEKFAITARRAWWCPLKRGHDGDHSNRFSRGEAQA